MENLKDVKHEELTAQVSSLLYGTPGNPPGSPGSCDGT